MNTPERPAEAAVSPAPASQVPTADSGVLEKFPLLDRESRRRRDSDVQISYAMYLVVGIFTLGVYVIYVHFKLIQSQQEHFKRMGRFNEDLFGIIEERAANIRATQKHARAIDEMRVLNEEFRRLQRGKERSPGLWILLSVVTLGLAFLYVLYFLNADLREHQRAEAEYIEKASALLNKLGIGKHPVIVEQVVPDRSYPLYLLLTVVTPSLFEFYWSYVRIKDQNQHFLEHDRFEDQLVGLIRSAA